MIKMTERLIDPVKDGKDKQNTYKGQMQRLELALEYEFYFEAMIICYAAIEDRLLSMIYHMGFLEKRNVISIEGERLSVLAEISPKFKSNEKNEQTKAFNLYDISHKIDVVKSVIKWVNETEGGYENNIHLKALKLQCESIDYDGLKDCFKKLKNGINTVTR